MQHALANGELDPDSMLVSAIGQITMPLIHIKADSDLRPMLERLGIARIFNDSDAFRTLLKSPDGARLESFRQKVSLDVDQRGIRADAETRGAGVYGGILAGLPEPFHMTIDRPFLFYVRDSVTDAPLYMGVVMNPAVD